MMTSLGKPAARRSALPVPPDPLHSFLGFLFTGGANRNGCGWLDNFENDIEFGVLADDLEAEFPGIPGEDLAPPDTTTTAILTNNVVAAGAPSERGAEAASEPTSASRSDDSSSEEDDDDMGDPCFHPKAKKRVRPAQKQQQQQQRGPTGQWKPKSVPLVAVVAVEEGARHCRECDTTQTTQWRAGPGGPNTLCNACGLRWKKKHNAKRQPAAKTSHAKHSKNNLCTPCR
ncbi:hypothetical protein QOZ80_5BG0418120 [Eleusine coracana subsp. coracana]|nr:hypothetical protein QOZ80_5BG0418120 [Eleusine coracana subsp. coracana]